MASPSLIGVVFPNLKLTERKDTMTTSVANPPADIPRLRALDSSLAFLGDGYLFGTRQFREHGTDAFRTRIMGKPATIMYGADAAQIFYEDDRFGRERAMPTSVLHLLQDEGSVQALSGEAHRHRKSLFIQLLSTPNALSRLTRTFRDEFLDAVGNGRKSMVLHDEMNVVLTRTVLQWAGVTLDNVDVQRLSEELSSMIENAGRFGPSNWAARARRQRTEEWARTAIRNANIAEDSMLAQFATHHELDGSRLDTASAAVELLNVLRPTVAVARFIVFAAHALLRHPDWQIKLLTGDPDHLEHFVQEVRRFYPFFPVIGGRAQRDFEWRNTRFAAGDWVLLDLYATNHDERLWTEPNRFRPERFEHWDGDRNSLIPQGAGDAATGHRCPGERATIELMKEATSILAGELQYTVPDQDLRISLRGFPALPRSRFLMTSVTQEPTERSTITQAPRQDQSGTVR
jgi:fatty-acid peroxygenase